VLAGEYDTQKTIGGITNK